MNAPGLRIVLHVARSHKRSVPAVTNSYLSTTTKLIDRYTLFSVKSMVRGLPCLQIHVGEELLYQMRAFAEAVVGGEIHS